MTLNDKVALVLGGTGGPGSAITQRLASDGCKVYATYSSESGSQRATALSHSAKMIRTDAADEHQVHLPLKPLLRNRKVYMSLSTQWAPTFHESR